MHEIATKLLKSIVCTMTAIIIARVGCTQNNQKTYENSQNTYFAKIIALVV